MIWNANCEVRHVDAVDVEAWIWKHKYYQSLLKQPKSHFLSSCVVGVSLEFWILNVLHDGGKELILLFTFTSNNNKYLWVHAKQIFCIDGAALMRKRKGLSTWGQGQRTRNGWGEKGFEQKQTICRINMLEFKFLYQHESQTTEKNYAEETKGFNPERKKIIALHCSKIWTGKNFPDSRNKCL